MPRWKTILPLIFRLSSRTSVLETPKKRLNQGTRLDFSGFFGGSTRRAWHRLPNTSKIGVLKSVKDAPASKEFS
jgi:hypothetical protein